MCKLIVVGVYLSYLISHNFAKIDLEKSSSMPKRLTIILGAGASHSLNPDPKALDSQGLRPPLARDIFRGNAEFRRILNKYPLAENLASDIDRRIRQNKDGVGLEQILKIYEVFLNEGKDTLVTRQFLQIPLYLNELFGEVSGQFTRQPDEYNTLVNLAIGNVDEVLFLTLNYDNLLEIPLSRNFGIDFSDEAHYTDQKGWALVKIHGSINWYKQFQSYSIQSTSEPEYFSLLKSCPLPLQLGSEFKLISMGGYGHKYIESIPVYPAITVPVDGKYDINCPKSQVEKMEDFLPNCHNYLIIGTSGKDQDLLDILKKNVRSAKVMLVGREEESTAETRKRFMAAVPQFDNSIDTFYHERGFSQFVDSGMLDEFIEKLPIQ